MTAVTLRRSVLVTRKDNDIDVSAKRPNSDRRVVALIATLMVYDEKELLLNHLEKQLFLGNAITSKRPGGKITIHFLYYSYSFV